ncbi:MAG: acyl-CoA dehydrogenase family protein [Fimbriimonas sp.]
MEPSPTFQAGLRFLTEDVAPVAERIDQDPEELRKVLARMGELGLCALRRPLKYGGPEMEEGEFRRWQEELARRSGTLAFLQTQHQSAVGMIASSDNDELKQATLPGMHDGTRGIGIGFSQLRRSGDPIMRATPVPGGYVLAGHVPWVTGWTFYPEFLIGASLPDGRSVFAIVPLTTQEGVVVSPPMRLAAMGAALTVTVDFSGFFVPDALVAFIRPAGWIQNNDKINIALQGHFALGCAQAGIDIVRSVAARKPFPFLSSAADSLQSELDDCRTEMVNGGDPRDEGTTEARLQFRAWVIDLAVRCAHAGVTASSGAANSLDNRAQRVYREALVYTVSAQTPDVMRATINRLSQRHR